MRFRAFDAPRMTSPHQTHTTFGPSSRRCPPALAVYDIMP